MATAAAAAAKRGASSKLLSPCLRLTPAFWPDARPAGLLKSAYEIARDERVLKNHAFLQSLGLGTSGSEATAATPSVPAPKSAKRIKRARREPTRKSLRAQGLNPDGSDAPLEEEEPWEEEPDAERVMRAKIARLEALHSSNGTSYKNPTATYQHTWMRVKTMSDKALGTRIKVIEKALGQHCLVKMQMFAEVLALAGKQELASEAHAALQRVCDLLA
jgi:hypothetical protein